MEDLVEIRVAREGWIRAREGTPLRIGDSLRTGPRGLARIEFPGMSLHLSGASRLSVPPSLVLATLLEEGRLEQDSQSGDMIKLLTAEATIRGAGHVVVRRERGRTLVSALAGTIRVEAKGHVETLGAGEGTLVAGGRAPRAPAALAPAPVELDPGDDPLYVGVGKPVTLRFSSTARAHHLQLRAFESEPVLLEQDFGEAPASVSIPWPGTYRWRVFARDADGLEGLASRDGLIAVVAK